jgi:hypothetical protein
VSRAAELAAAPQQSSREEGPQAAEEAQVRAQRKQKHGGGGGGGGRATVLGGCVRAYHGVSPSLAEELCAAAGVQPRAHPSEVSDGEWGALHAAWRGWLERLESGSYAATLDEAGGRCVCAGEGGKGGRSCEPLRSIIAAGMLRYDTERSICAAPA